MKLLRTTLLFVLFSLFLCSTAFAAAVSWATDPTTGTKIGYVHDNFTIVSATWSGPAVDGKADGSGNLTLTVKSKDGKTYSATAQADMKAGIMNGRVAIKWSDGYSFDGTYKDGAWVKGIFRHPTGDVYEGEFLNGFYNGYGIFKFAKGGSYEGEFKNGQYDGKGIYKWPDGGIYDGEWKNSQYNGKGIFKWADGRVYEGDFKNSAPNGFGVGKDASGKVVHDGEWKDGQPVTPLKATNVLGVPWGATEEQAKDILLKRPNTQRVSFLDGKDGDNKWLYFQGPFAEFPDAWIYVYFYQGKMWQFRISWPLKDDQIIDRYNALKQGLTGRYGPPSTEQGKYLDSRAWWDLGQTYHVGIEILQNKIKIAAADPTPNTHPFRVYVTYYNKAVVDIVYGNKSGSSGGSKDY